ncbi:MAG: RNA-directed DNA polymerase [Rickettsiales bacterium]|nr:RNA-directed DNA polymerase [Rickettsiales bacterium]
MFSARFNCGLPIGNLTSQLFSNIYLHDFDSYVKDELKLPYYGRYVDDFIIMHSDKEYLKKLIPLLSSFLQQHLMLSLHPKKIYLQHYTKGVSFVGTIIKPYRKYIRKRTLGYFYQKIQQLNKQLMQIHEEENLLVQ